MAGMGWGGSHAATITDARDTLESPRQRAGAVATTPVIIVLLTALGVALRCYQLTRPGMLLGPAQYDDAAYFGSAVRLLDGFVPYRDFVIVHPPGVTLLLSPVAVIAKLTGTDAGLGIARVLTACVGGASVAVGGLLVRRWGPLAVLVACAILAVHPDSIASAQSVFLEPWLVLFCLLGALAAFPDGSLTASPRHLRWAGAAFGLACAVKVWAAVPVLVLGVIVLSNRSRVRPFLAGLIGALVVVVGPFAALAPRAFFRDVLLAQLSRVDNLRVPAHSRLASIFGLTDLSLSPTEVIAVAALIAILVGVAMLVARRPPDALWWFAAAGFGLTLLMLLWPVDYYFHYAAFSTAFLAVAVALPVSRVAASGRRLLLDHHARAPGLPEAALAAVLVVALTGGAVLAGRDASRLRAAGPPAAERALIPSGACVLTDWPDYTLTADRFASSAPGCDPMVDPVGTDYALSHGRNALSGAGRVQAVVQTWLSAFRQAQYVWLSCAPPAARSCDGLANRRIPWTPAILGYFLAHFRSLSHRTGYLYTRVM